MSKLASTFLPTLRFWIENFITHDLLNWIYYQKIKFCGKFFFQIFIFLGRFTPLKRQSSFFALSWKSWFRDEQFGKKTYFEAKFVKRIKFNHFLVLINFRNETSTACQSVNQTFVFTSCQIFNQPFYYPSDLNRIFHNASDFEVKLFRENPLLLIFIRKDQFLSVLTTETSKLTLSCFLENFYSQKGVWKKNQILNQTFREESDFDSSFLQSVHFWIEKFETCQFSRPFSKTC